MRIIRIFVNRRPYIAIDSFCGDIAGNPDRPAANGSPGPRSGVVASPLKRRAIPRTVVQGAADEIHRG